MADRLIISDYATIDEKVSYGGEPALASAPAQIAQRLQYILGWSAARLVGCQYVPSPDATDRATFYRWRWRHTWTNARALLWRVLALPRTTNAGSSPQFTMDGTATGYGYYLPGGTPTVPADVREFGASKALVPTATEREIVFGSSNAARIVAVAAYQHMATAAPAGWVLDDATYKLLDLAIFQASKHVFAQDVAKLIDVVQNDSDAIFTTARRQHFCWSVRGSGAVDAITRTLATFGNIFDQSLSTRTATSPGFTCPALWSGRYTAAATQTVECDIEVYAALSVAGSATVRFISSVTTGNVTVNSTTPQWWKVAQGVKLSVTDTTDKVDVLIASDGTAELRVWAVRCQENPA